MKERWEGGREVGRERETYIQRYYIYTEIQGDRKTETLRHRQRHKERDREI